MRLHSNLDNLTVSKIILVNAYLTSCNNINFTLKCCIYDLDVGFALNDLLIFYVAPSANGADCGLKLNKGVYTAIF